MTTTNPKEYRPAVSAQRLQIEFLSKRVGAFLTDFSGLLEALQRKLAEYTPHGQNRFATRQGHTQLLS